MRSTQSSICLRHNRQYELLGNDGSCELNCRICCQCLHSADHGHKKDIVNHQTMSMEQLNHHFNNMCRMNSSTLLSCQDALEQYFNEVQMAVQMQLQGEKQRLNKTIRHIMLSDITDDQKCLHTLTALLDRKFQEITCKDVYRASKPLFTYTAKEPPLGLQLLSTHIHNHKTHLTQSIKHLFASAPFTTLSLATCDAEIKDLLKRHPHKKQPKVESPLQETKPIREGRREDFAESKLIEGKEDNTFVMKMFERKVNCVRLLYRASEEGFSIKTFHKACDGESDTLVVAMTEFGKVVGGFTPVAWRSTANTLHSDTKKESFLFSLSLKQKMPLIDEKSATFNSINTGPTFGAGADLAIFNKANVERTSYSEFPYSYANTRYKENNQHSTTLFTGQKHGNHFLLLEWEVWKISFIS